MQKDLCECCKNDFDEMSRKPRVLECQCILCESCLQFMVNFQGFIMCKKHEKKQLHPIEDLPILNLRGQLEPGQHQDLSIYTQIQIQNSEDQSQRKEEAICKLHNKEFTSFHLQDNIKICNQCVQGYHSKLQIIPIEDRVVQLQKEIEKSLENLGRFMDLRQRKQNQTQLLNKLKFYQFTVRESSNQFEIDHQKQIKTICNK